MTRSLIDAPHLRDRMEAMLACVDYEHLEVVVDRELATILRSLGGRNGLEPGGLERRGRAKELITLTRIGDLEVFPGYAWSELRDGRREARDSGVLCQTGVEIQSVIGCPFDCSYCPYSAFVCAWLDVEGFVDRVTRLVDERPQQLLYKLNNRSDTLALEPEYGLAPRLIERFATLDQRYLMLYTKGDAVTELCDLDHRGKTIACFTLTPEPMAELLEPGAPALEQRIAALASLARAGYPIRVRLSPIVPLRGWRAAYADLLARLYRVAEVELITLWTLSMIDLASLDRIVPTETLDPDILARARQDAASLAGDKGAPLPPDVRTAIYREIAAMIRDLSTSTCVSLCLETPEVWQATAPFVVRRTGRRFVCNCGPRITPAAVAHAARRSN